MWCGWRRGRRGFPARLRRGDADGTRDTHPAAAGDPDPKVEEDLLRIRTLLEQHDIEGARAYVKDLAARWPDSAQVQHYARVLAPPVARVVEDSRPAKARDLELAWLREHGHEYPGCWLSILDDRLIAADPSLSAVIARTGEAVGDASALLFYQPPLMISGAIDIEVPTPTWN